VCSPSSVSLLRLAPNSAQVGCLSRSNSSSGPPLKIFRLICFSFAPAPQIVGVNSSRFFVQLVNQFSAWGHGIVLHSNNSRMPKQRLEYGDQAFQITSES
jgi:hypothetical protein